MAYASNSEIRIYYETEGHGPPLFLHHAMMGSHESWHEYGYVEALKEDFELIIIDAIAHGLSDRPPRSCRLFDGAESG